MTTSYVSYLTKTTNQEYIPSILEPRREGDDDG
jgi:hypothetical protein